MKRRIGRAKPCKPCEPAMKIEGLPWDNAMRALLKAQPPNADALDHPVEQPRQQATPEPLPGAQPKNAR